LRVTAVNPLLGKTSLSKQGIYAARWEMVKSWFSYKLHLMVDARYELPLAFEEHFIRGLAKR